MAKKRLKKRSLEVTESIQPLSAASPFAPVVNDGLDREMIVTGRTIEGTPIQVATFKIVQLGLREEFIPDDSSEGMQDSTGEIFGVMKEDN